MKLRGVTWDHPRGYDPLVAASELQAQARGVDVVWDKRSLQAFADESISDLAERYDLIVLDHPHVGQIADAGALTALPDALDLDGSLGGSAQSYYWKGTCWAYAIDTACQMAAYRPDLRAPLPKFWEAFLSDDAHQYRALTPLLPVDAFDMMMTLVAGRGGEVMPHDLEHFVSNDNGIYALTILRALYKLGPDEQVDMNPIRVFETLSTENEFACSPCLFGYVNYARPGFRKHQISYFDLPLSQGFSKPRAILGGAGIGVSAHTKHPDEATRFAQWIASEEVQSAVYLDNNGQPAHRGTWLEQQHNPKLAGFFKGGFYTIDNAWTRPRDSWFIGFVDDICDIMPDFFRKEIPIDMFLDRLNTIYRHHIKGA